MTVKTFVHGTQNREQGTPAKGDLIRYHKTTGHVFSQDRPWDCRYRCQCGKCDGVGRDYESLVTSVTHYMDNSVEVRTSKGHTLMWEYPHGDAC